METVLRHQATGRKLRFYVVHLTAGNAPDALNPCEPASSTRRLRQGEYLIGKVRGRAEVTDFPPIVVGDFNAGRDYRTGRTPEDSVRLMEAHFWLPLHRLYERAPGHPETEELLARLRALHGEGRGIEWFRRRCDRLHDEGSDGWLQCSDDAEARYDGWRQRFHSQAPPIWECLGPQTGIDQVYVGKRESFPESLGNFRPLERLDIPLHGISDHGLADGYLLQW